MSAEVPEVTVEADQADNGNDQVNPYDPRRLFPFGLSPIPEVPSELASGDSSICVTPTPDPEDDEGEEVEEEEEEEEDEEDEEDADDSDTEVESVKSVIANSNVESPDEQDDEVLDEKKEEEAEESSDQEEENVNEVEKDADHDSANPEEKEDQSTSESRPSSRKSEERALFNPEQLENLSGAETASEIFRHLQATRKKNEVTSELAKILNVLETTIKNRKKSDDESSDSDNTDKSKSSAGNVLRKKPPLHPNSSSAKETHKADIVRHSKVKTGKDEMSILSKILVTLLCSCKSSAAAEELRKIIRQFKDAAAEATDEISEELIALSGRSSRSGRRRSLRVRRSSGSSNASHSETESLTNTLTPSNTDSKSSEDESNSKESTRTMKFSVKIDQADQNPDNGTETAVSVTVKLPRKSSSSETTDKDVVGDIDEGDDDDESQDTLSSVVESPKTKRMKQMSRNDSSTSTESNRDPNSETRRLFSDMECGAYNSDSFNSSGHSGISDACGSEQCQDNGHEESDEVSWATDEHAVSPDTSTEKQKTMKVVKEMAVEKVEGQLINHLEETFKVLSGAYRIITGAHCSNDKPNSPKEVEEEDEKSFEEILDGVSNECAALENEIRKSSTPKGPTPQQDEVMGQKVNSRPVSRIRSRPSSRVDGGRPRSKLQSRPSSRSVANDEEWGDEDEWEYYYEDEEEEETGHGQEPVAPSQGQQASDLSQTTMNEAQTSLKPPLDEPTRPVSRQRKSGPSSRPNSRSGSRAGSRPVSRTGSRPGSRASRMGMRTPLRGIGEQAEDDDEDWEWEYYDEDEEELQCLSPAITTAPTTRATSPFPQAEDQVAAPRKLPKRDTEPLAVNRATLMSPAMKWEEGDDVCEVQPLDGAVEFASELVHNESGLLSPICDVSVALAAEYLGQTKSDIVASLPQDLYASPDPKAVKKKKKKKKKQTSESDTEEKSERKRKKKKKKKKVEDEHEDEDDKKGFFPRLGVKALVKRLEPQLFKNMEAGTKMVMSKESLTKSKEIEAELNAKTRNGQRRKSVKEIVQIMSTAEPVDTSKTDDPMDAKNVGRVLDAVEQFSSTIPEPPPPPPPPKDGVVVFRSVPNSSTMEVIQGDETTVVNMRSRPTPTGARRKERPTTLEVKKSRNSPEESEAYGTGSSDSEESHIKTSNSSQQPETAKKPNRHSRLFRLLQDSDYTDSDSSEACRSMKDLVGTTVKDTDQDTMSSLSRKHSFRSMESDCDSVKLSPQVLRRDVKAPRKLSGKGQEPSIKGAVARLPATRVWNYLQDEFDSMEDSSYQSQSLHSLESLQTPDSLAREIEEVTGRRKVSRDHSFRSAKDVSSPVLNSPKLEMELLELSSLPTIPALTLRSVSSRSGSRN